MPVAAIRSPAFSPRAIRYSSTRPGAALPMATVIVNPNQPDDNFPSKNLAGVGVIFYVMLALRAHLRESGWFAQQNLPEPNLARLLDLVALGTVAMASLFNAVGPATNPYYAVPFWWHMVAGGWAFGMVFMATDPVTAPYTEAGRWIYGILIGAIADRYEIRAP